MNLSVCFILGIKCRNFLLLDIKTLFISRFLVFRIEFFFIFCLLNEL